MAVQEFHCLHAFLQRVLGLLERDEVGNNLPLGILQSLLKGYSSLDEPPRFWIVEEDEGKQPADVAEVKAEKDVAGLSKEEKRIHLVLLRTPPHNVVVTAPQLALAMDAERARVLEKVEAAVAKAVDVLVEDGVQFPGVIGLRPVGDVFAKAWGHRAGLTAELDMEQRVYSLKKLKDVPPTEGAMRQAVGSDAPLLIQWQQEFCEEALPNEPHVDYARTIMRMLDNGALFLWVVDGQPRSMAAESRSTRRGIVVSDVYTPKMYRGRGYATALVHGLSARLLQSYEYCSLYTDLGNPTSNSIYTKIGYEPIRDSVVYRFLAEHPTD